MSAISIQKEGAKKSISKKIWKVDVYKEEDNRLAFVTHYFYNKRNGVARFYQEEALKFIKEEIINAKSANEVKEYMASLFDESGSPPFPKPYKPKFKFIDLFAGIGGFRIALQALEGECVFSSEYDPFCKLTYLTNFGEVPFGDIRRIQATKIPDHDILCAGFPCQPFSLAGVVKKNSLGKKHGFLDETQGTLFFEIVRIIKAKRPKAIFLENVKNLLSHDKKKTFKIIFEALNELGYNLHYDVLDGKYYVPQHRERIIIVGFDKNVFKAKEKFAFPEPPKKHLKIKDILEVGVDQKYTLTSHLWSYLKDYAARHKLKGNGFGYGLVDLEGVARTMSARYYKDGAEILIPQENKNPRRLSPPECARLQGFPKRFIIPVSDNQAYKQFGNAVVVPLIEAVGKNIVKEL